MVIASDAISQAVQVQLLDQPPHTLECIAPATRSRLLRVSRISINRSLEIRESRTEQEDRVYPRARSGVCLQSAVKGTPKHVTKTIDPTPSESAIRSRAASRSHRSARSAFNQQSTSRSRATSTEVRGQPLTSGALDFGRRLDRRATSDPHWQH
jgi:hypothetical protein